MVRAMTLSGRTIGLYLAPGYDADMVSRLEGEMRRRGAVVVSISTGEMAAGSHVPGSSISLTQRSLKQTDQLDMDALVIPAGPYGESVFAEAKALTLLISLQHAKKPVGALGDAPRFLAAAGLVSGRRVTGSENIRGMMKKAGAVFVEQKVVVDHKLVTAVGTEGLSHFLEAVALLLEPATARG